MDHSVVRFTIVAVDDEVFSVNEFPRSYVAVVPAIGSDKFLVRLNAASVENEREFWG
jgi:hypothetical protein